MTQTSDVSLKRCSKCGEEKPATTEFFYRHRKDKEELRSGCKKCYNQASLAYNKANPDKVSHEKRKHYPSQKSEQLKIRRRANASRWNKLHRERMLEFKSAWNKNNLDKIKAYTKAHPDIGRVGHHNYRARKRATKGIHTAAQIQDLLKHQRNRCYYCYKKFAKAKGKYIYHIDHTFPLARVVGTDIPANDISYLVLACPTCNMSKGDKFPHEFFEGGKLL